MSILSAILFFLTQHPFWSWPLLTLFGVALSHVLARWRGSPGWYGLILVFFIYGQLNIFLAHIFNALFLSAFGVPGTGVVTHSEMTSSTLNDANVWAYSAALKTADGKDVVTTFDSMSASIYPITNAILIPPEGERFVTRYIPGFPRNFVIMRNQSSYGIRQMVAEDRAPVDKAANQLAASPGNRAFIDEYRDALTRFLGKHREDADPALIERYQAALDALPRR
ncbi:MULTISPECIES: hypothetical protein [unclassified Sphingomonas]|uniref:hypothetical protein n=1 Tax=unclassified Sphingomonas TaxID=196159 RepID=UPI0009272C0F|nr:MULTISPECIES: hypothetical protein [unclassified Sphingomonas]OJU17132.1 MAG: hypothetical protein BGN95_10285 [Sphingomonas sp. 66-10]